MPRLFPNGRRVGDEWRLANIQGDAPRKHGSCVIALKGEHAGDWHDFDGGEGGGPLSAIEEATGLTGRDLFAARRRTGGLVARRAGPSGAAAQPKPERDTAREIAFILGARGAGRRHAGGSLPAPAAVLSCPRAPICCSTPI